MFVLSIVVVAFAHVGVAVWIKYRERERLSEASELGKSVT